MNPADAETQSSGEGRELTGSVIAVLGCGAVGGALAAELAAKGAEVVLWSRTRARAEELARRLGQHEPGCTVTGEAHEALERAALVALCVTDAVLEEFAEDQAQKAPQSTSGERVVVHTNGFHGLEVLAPWRSVGWEVGKLHPLTSFPPGGGGRLRGAWFATAATGGARRWVRRLLSALGGRELELGDEEETSRTVHAAAALLSGGVVALFEAAAGVVRPSIGDPEAADRAFLSLLASTAGNLWVQGSRDALTGPASRGAADIVSAHLKTLDEKDAYAADLYRRLGARMIALAAARGSIDEQAFAELERVLRTK